MRVQRRPCSRGGRAARRTLQKDSDHCARCMQRMQRVATHSFALQRRAIPRQALSTVVDVPQYRYSEHSTPRRRTPTAQHSFLARSHFRRRAHTHTHTHMHTHTHAHARTRTRTHTHTHAHARTHTRAHTRTRTHMHAHTHARTHAHARTCTHTHTRTHAHTHAHTHVRPQVNPIRKTAASRRDETRHD